MKTEAAKEPRARKARESAKTAVPARPEKEPVPCLPVSPCDDLHIRIAQRAYELHADRGYRQGYALDDWLEAEREILGAEYHA
jgi:hypothetical protein